MSKRLPLIDHGNDDAAQIDHSLQELGRLGDPGDPIRRARHFHYCFHRQPELIRRRAETPGTSAPRSPGRSAGAAAMLAGFAESFHDVPPKKLFRRKDRDEPAPFLAAIDRFDARLAPERA